MEWGTISIVAALMAFLSLCLRWRFPSVPPFLASAGVGVGLCGLLLTQISLGYWLSASLLLNAAFVFGVLDQWLFSPKQLSPALDTSGATLRLNFFGDDRHPLATKTDNVGTWVAYFSPEIRAKVTLDDGTDHYLGRTPKTWVIFTSFENLVESTQIVVSHNSGTLPPYNVLISTKQACAIAFAGEIPPGVLEIDVLG
jgi:hypothetical protein